MRYDTILDTASVLYGFTPLARKPPSAIRVCPVT